MAAAPIEPYDVHPQAIDQSDPVFSLHRKGKIEIRPTVQVRDREGLSLAYTPGVAKVSRAIADDPSLAWDYTWKGGVVAVVTDGTAVLGLGDIGPEAALPVMEGKALLFKEFGGVDAVPICLDCTDVDDIVDTVVRIAPGFGGINLEDISAPRCFEIERRLQDKLDIPVFHDDQHGTAIVTLAALRNAARLTDRELADMRVVMSGAGAAGVAITKLLQSAGVGDVLVVDSRGIINRDRADLNPVKRDLAAHDQRRGPVRQHHRRAARRRRARRGLGRDHPGGRGGRHGPRRHRLRDGQPRPRGAPDGGRPARPGGRDRAQRLPQPDQQRAGLPRGLPGRPRGACHRASPKA